MAWPMVSESIQISLDFDSADATLLAGISASQVLIPPAGETRKDEAAAGSGSGMKRNLSYPKLNLEELAAADTL